MAVRSMHSCTVDEWQKSVFSYLLSTVGLELVTCWVTKPSAKLGRMPLSGWGRKIV